MTLSREVNFYSPAICMLMIVLPHPQHEELPPEQSQVGSVPFKKPIITAVAHPVPAATESAPKAQFRAQAPHSMHASRSTISTEPSLMEKTSWGQTSMQMPQPLHLSLSRESVATLERYFIPFIP
jgi:hypothetical protein